MKSLAELRARLDVLDRQILELVAERQLLGGEIAAVKRTTGQSTRDFRREREVLLKARTDAEALGVSRQTVNSIDTGRYTPSLPLAIALARLFRIPVEEMFYDG